MLQRTERVMVRPRPVTRALRGGVVALVVVAVSLVGVGVASGSVPAKKKSGQVLATLKITSSGVEVKAKGASSYVVGKEGQELKQGDALRTDATGKAEIAYTDGSLTRLGVSTEFAITKLTSKQGARQTQGSLTVGSTWNRAAKVTQSGEFSIKAGGATAAVEGTAFVVTCPPASSASTVACTVTAIVDSVGVGSDDWTVTSVENAQ